MALNLEHYMLNSKSLVRYSRVVCVTEHAVCVHASCYSKKKRKYGRHFQHKSTSSGLFLSHSLSFFPAFHFFCVLLKGCTVFRMSQVSAVACNICVYIKNKKDKKACTINKTWSCLLVWERKKARQCLCMSGFWKKKKILYVVFGVMDSGSHLEGDSGSRSWNHEWWCGHLYKQAAKQHVFHESYFM